ncbi:hypothetical protein L1N85_24670 [Paenibacillus alkaliterrae]|uniref:hypothetical protein n=1 Tax=Paenibacillus alkaliterrae TaxID=320909 RepID=UPI001F1CA4B1|nr:hypothetical protein [Paenibacillus alkaliterrae]MCF2941536.1 hypothetical protein [Paenibacillus alkaliterrae]
MMKPIYKMDQIQWNMLLSDVAEYFDDAVIAGGQKLYKQRRVIALTMPAAQMLGAEVDDDGLYHIQMNLDFFAVSHCSCEESGYCAHMFAALLEYATQQHRSVQELANAKWTAVPKQEAKLSPQTAAYRKAIAIADKKNAVRTELQERIDRMTALSILEWHETFALCTAPLGERTRNLQYAHDALAAIHKIKPKLSPVMQQLYELHTHLFVLDNLTKQSLRSSQYSFYQSGLFIGFNTHSAAVELLEAIERIFEKGLAVNDEPESWPSVIETLTYSRKKMLTASDNSRYFGDPYELLWMHWITPNLSDTAFYDEELQHLQAAEKELGTDLSRYPWLLSQSRMHFHLGGDKEAWALLESLHESVGVVEEDLLHFLYDLHQLGQWQRLTDWLVATAPWFESQYGHMPINYSHYWDALLQKFPQAEGKMWETIVGLLPYSKFLYEEKLLAYGKWQKWMDYQLSTGSEPLDYRVTVFSPIEKHAPELLLPYYHQAVERYVLLKNRDSYKLAVKLLKRLAKLYKKVKKEAVWDTFLNAFASRNSRLRALQEELRKGKLIK